MTQRRWIDQSQPQTLQAAVMLSYLTAAFGVIFFLIFRAVPSLFLVALAVAAYGVANERRWAYRAAVVIAAIYLVLQVLLFFFIAGFSGLLNLIFAGVLLALLLHRQSREYEKIWFH